MIEGARDEYIIHGSLRLDAQLEGNIREPVRPDDAVAADQDARPVETALLLWELTLDCEPEQVGTEESGAIEEMHQAHLKATSKIDWLWRVTDTTGQAFRNEGDTDP